MADSVRAFGEQATIEAMVQHRNVYVTDEDLKLMRDNGVHHLRLNVGWWAFASWPLPQAETLVQDFCYSNLSFVTLSGPFLENLLTRFERYGIHVLLDIHAMPCGAADGTYNGVFPLPPVFFTHPGAKEYGLQIASNMLRWYRALPASLQGVIQGFTLLNEPGHLLVPAYMPNAQPIMEWLVQAVDIYRSEVVEHVPAGQQVPLLFMNLIETAFPGGCTLSNGTNATDPVDCMTFAMAVDMKLANTSWAVFDVHHYFAWDGGSGISDSDCNTSATMRSWVAGQMEQWTTNILGKGQALDLEAYSCSEWSLSMHRNDTQSCPAAHSKQIMYEEQVKSLKDAGFGQYFWGWKMPYGGWHEDKWSLKYHLTGLH